MKITVLAVGKIKDKILAEKTAQYARRLSKGVQLHIEEVQDSPKSREKEADDLIKRVPERARLIVLDEKGRDLDSQGFADIISKSADAGRDIVFVLGGAYGLHEKIKAAAEDAVCLSRLTFPHELARLILVEQIYRAFAILRNEPYHK